MSKLYNLTAERLWEKIEFKKSEFDMNSFDDDLSLIWDKFCKANPSARELALEVESEFKYELSNFQCSWAVMMAYKNVDMKKYNLDHLTSLQPRR